MGTWGTGTFENDTAMDVAGLWEQAIDDGMTRGEAAAYVRQSMPDHLVDADDGLLVEAAIAALGAGQRPG